MSRKGYITKRVAPHGYNAITRPLAKELYEKGIEVTICGNNVNSFHVFEGWCLGRTLKLTSEASETSDFDTIVKSFMWFLDRDLGIYPVFYVQSKDLVATL